MTQASFIDQVLDQTRTLLTNIARPELAGALAPYGYAQGSDRITAGTALRERVVELLRQRDAEHGEMEQALRTQEELRDQLLATYRHDLEVAREVFADDAEAWDLLGLGGRRKVSYAGLLGQTEQFYGNIERHPRIGGALAESGVSVDRQASGRGLVRGLAAAVDTHRNERGEASAATAALDEALDQLVAWRDRLLNLARAASRNDPTLLSRLGV